MKPRTTSNPGPTRAHGERGAALIMALAVMIAMGGIVGGLVTFITSSTRDAVNLTVSRNRQYAADGAIEQAIRTVQVGPEKALLGTGCANGAPVTPAAINGFSMRVDCAGAPAPILDALNRVVIERNVLFIACLNTGVACTNSNAVIEAKVNFPTNAAGVVSGSFVQSWSVR